MHSLDGFWGSIIFIIMVYICFELDSNGFSGDMMSKVPRGFGLRASNSDAMS